METLEIYHEFPFPMSEVAQGREARYVTPGLWPEIKNSEIISEVKDGNKIIRKRRVDLESDISRNKVFNNRVFSVIETAEINLKEDLYYIESNLDSFPNLVDFSEISNYYSIDIDGTKGCRRDITLTINIKVPMLGAMIAKLIAKEFKKLSDKDHQVILEYLAQKK